MEQSSWPGFVTIVYVQGESARMNVICVLGVVYALGKACVCVVILSKMVDDVTRGRRMVE